MQISMMRRLASEALGSAFLLMGVVGSGIMAERLSGGNMALALWGNTAATGALLAVLILVFGPLSGAHFNPAVSFVAALRREITLQTMALFIVAQIAGAVGGVMLAHLMFDLAAVSDFARPRTGPGQWLAEGIATFGLIGTILGVVHSRKDAVPYAVALYITAAYWFTASTSFANPAVTLARALTSSFSGIRMVDVGPFICAQMLGALAAQMVFGWLLSKTEKISETKYSEPDKLSA